MVAIQSVATRRISPERNFSNATALFKVCPTGLVFGLWDSTGPKGGLGAKFQRALVSEIVGINAANGAKTASRIDPLNIAKDAAVLYKAANRSFDGAHWRAIPHVTVRLVQSRRTGYGTCTV